MKDLRVNYTNGQLVEGNFPDDPFVLFNLWFNDAQSSDKIKEANAMVLSTVNQQSVDSRTVLLKDLRNNQFVFYTNYGSNKGQQLNECPNCTLLFPWIGLERQVIVRGIASKVSYQESTEYFLSRPRSSQIGAWASSQSRLIASRVELEDQLASFTDKFENEPITKPKDWGGYEVSPIQIEFWQGRENRLHDRILFENHNGVWQYKRLQP